MRTTERTRQGGARGAAIGADLRDAPSAIDFDVRGRTFTADVTPDPGGGYCATVRGHGDCFTEADALPELRECLAEVTELMLYGAGRADRQLAAVRATAGRWDDGRDAGEIVAEIEGARRGEGVTRTEAGMTGEGKQEVAELSGPAKTRAEDSATFAGETIPYSAPEVKGARAFAAGGGASPSALPGARVGTPEGGGFDLLPSGEVKGGGSVPTTAAGGRRQSRITEA